MLETAKLVEKQVIGLIGLDSLFPFPQSLYVQHSQEDIERIVVGLFGDNAYLILKNRVLTEFLSDKFNSVDKEWILQDLERLDINVLKSQTVELAKWDLIDVVANVDKPVKIIISTVSEEKGKQEFDKYFKDTIFVKGLKNLLMIEDHNLINKLLEDIIQSIVKNPSNT